MVCIEQPCGSICGRECVAMPLWGRKRKAYPQSEQVAKDGEDGEGRQGKGAKAPRPETEIGEAGAKAKDSAIFAAGRFHDLGLAPALSDHIHG